MSCALRWAGDGPDVSPPTHRSSAVVDRRIAHTDRTDCRVVVAMGVGGDGSLADDDRWCNGVSTFFFRGDDSSFLVFCFDGCFLLISRTVPAKRRSRRGYYWDRHDAMGGDWIGTGLG